jgi:hypothetical protein
VCRLLESKKMVAQGLNNLPFALRRRGLGSNPLIDEPPAGEST